jgi:hypothetical protein
MVLKKDSCTVGEADAEETALVLLREAVVVVDDELSAASALPSDCFWPGLLLAVLLLQHPPTALAGRVLQRRRVQKRNCWTATPHRRPTPPMDAESPNQGRQEAV